MEQIFSKYCFLSFEWYCVVVDIKVCSRLSSLFFSAFNNFLWFAERFLQVVSQIPLYNFDLYAYSSVVYNFFSEEGSAHWVIFIFQTVA